jgi:hypothetical protein
MTCKKEAGAPEAGTAKAVDILSLIPVDVQGVIFVDVNNAMSTDFANKMIQDSDDYQKYQEFVEKTGIDPQKDIYYVAVGIAGDLEGDDQEGVAVINMKYDPNTVLGLIKEKAAEEEQEIQEKQYEGHAVYQIWQEGEPIEFSFIDDSNIVAGNEIHVKSVLDVLDKKKDNVFKNKELSAIIDKTNKDAMLWGAILLPPETMEKAASSNPMMGALKSISAIALYFDYKNQNIIAEIMAMSPDAESNKQVAEALTGIKSFGAMAAGEKPELGELLNAIQISSGDDHVKIFAEIPEELIKKLQAEESKEEE